jgi:hypothetical protein
VVVVESGDTYVASLVASTRISSGNKSTAVVLHILGKGGSESFQARLRIHDMYTTNLPLLSVLQVDLSRSAHGRVSFVWQ